MNIIPAYTPKLSGVLTSAVIPALEAAYTAATDQKHIKAVITLNSNGPFMQCYPAEVLRGIRYFCDTHGLHFISDEAYANTVFGAKATPFTSALALIKGEENGSSRVEQSTIDPSLVHVIWSATKDFGSTGIRSVSINTIFSGFFHPGLIVNTLQILIKSLQAVSYAVPSLG